MATPGRLSSGIEDLDHLLRGLIPGDNVVWVAASNSVVGAIEERSCTRPSGPASRART